MNTDTHTDKEASLHVYPFGNNDVHRYNKFDHVNVPTYEDTKIQTHFYMYIPSKTMTLICKYSRDSTVTNLNQIPQSFAEISTEE